MPQSYTCLHHHLIFSTKGRLPLLIVGIQARLWEYFGGILRSRGCVLLAAGGMPDHVHLLIGLNKEMAISDCLRIIKTNSSSWIHQTFPGVAGFAWQTGYGAFAVSYSQLEVAKQYIAQQEEHHRTLSFQDEFVAFLQRHNIEYNPKYLWD
jgi:putative transposase